MGAAWGGPAPAPAQAPRPPPHPRHVAQALGSGAAPALAANSGGRVGGSAFSSARAAPSFTPSYGGGRAYGGARAYDR